ncbi:fatty acid hydroxylase domain-containing protein 2-like [Cloeon dipterum]|uniref:fatty acid hydroxylase domain-containing protein 2-like n=1 Tax=Cloeon dipterum TaxID=197152 RepID=UPI00322090CF
MGLNFKGIRPAVLHMCKHSLILFLHYYILINATSRILFFVTGGFSLEEYFVRWWQRFCLRFGDQPLLFFTVCTTVISTVVYWLIGSFFIVLDNTGWLSKYKVQPGTNQPPDSAKLRKVIITVLKSQLLFATPYTVLGYFALQIVGGPMTMQRLLQVPSLERILLELAFHDFVYEVTFYLSHKLLHTKWLYKRVHKTHHEWAPPIAVAAAYAHPFEYVVSNTTPISAGPIIIGSHPLSIWTWVAYLTLQTLTVHSNYHLPGFQNPLFHDFHHVKFNQNYGSVGFMDRLFGTDELFQKNKSKKYWDK